MVVSQDPGETERVHPVRAIDRHDLHGQSALLSQADLLVFGGGGLCNDYWLTRPADVLDDAWGGLPYYLRLPLLACLCDVPVAVYAQGVGPLVTPEARRMVRHVFNQAAVITVRDKYSAKLLRDLQVTVPVTTSADPAFSLAPDDDEGRAVLRSCGVPEGQVPLIGVSVRPFASITAGRLNLLARSVGEFAASLGAHVVILPFCRRGSSADFDCSKTFADALPENLASTIVEAELTPRGMLAAIGEMDCMLAMRYHACIFAVRQHVPFTAVAYDPKVDSLLAEVGAKELTPLNPNILERELVTAKLEQVWKVRDRIGKALARAADRFRGRVPRTGDQICKLLEQRPRVLGPAAPRQTRALWAPDIHRKSVRKQLEEAQEQLAKVRDQLAETRGQLGRSREETADTRRQADVTNKQREQLLSDARQAVKKADEKLNILRAEKSRLQAELSQAERRVAEVRKTLEQADQTLNDLRSERSGLQERNRKAALQAAKVEAQLEGAERVLEELRRRAEAAEAGAKSAETQRDQLQDRARQHEQQLEEARHAAKDANAALDSLRSERDELHRDLEAAKRQTQVAEAATEAAEKQRSDLEQSLAEELGTARRQAEAADTERARLETRLSQGDQELQKARQAAKTGEDTASALRSEREELGSDLQEARRQIQAAATQAEAVRKRQGELEAQLCQRAEQLKEAKQNVERLRQKGEALDKKCRFADERARDVAEQLQQLWDTPTWQLLNRLHNSRAIGGSWRLVKRAVPMRAKEYVKRRIRRSSDRRADPVVAGPTPTTAAEPPTRAAPGATGPIEGKASSPLDTPADPGPAAPSSKSGPPTSRTTGQLIRDLGEFLDRVERSDRPDLVVFVSGVKYVQSEGQRVTQIVREFIRNDVPVLLLYFRWQSEYQQAVPVADEPLFFQLPMDLFEAHKKGVLDYPFRSSLRRTCVFEFPHPWTFQWVNEYNAAGWRTVYDIIDDWEEFHEAGKAIWYEPAVEQYLCANASAVAAIVPLLAEKARGWVPDLKVETIPNGVSPDSFDMSLPPKPLPRGKLTVGYFGYLAQAWFDWEMVAKIAANRPDWVFHIVGYGEKIPVKLTDNVHLLGKVPHHLLYSYAQNWDVGMVPFKPTTLSKGADPIKVYEYLTLGLPVVTTDIPHLRDYPGVYVAESPEEFDRYLEVAGSKGKLGSDVKPFLEKCTWYRRGLALLEAAHRGRCERVLVAGGAPR